METAQYCRLNLGERGGAEAMETCHCPGTPQKEGSNIVRQLQGYLAGSAHRRKIPLKIIAGGLSEYCKRVDILTKEQNGF